MKNAIDWFEIPSKDFSRAVRFYSQILGEPLQDMSGPQMPYASFPHERMEGVGGAVSGGECRENTIVYLHAGDDLNGVLSKVEESGGKILTPKTSIGPYGFIAIIQDTEGNQVGLHSMH